MLRWLALLMLIAPCSGCMLMDDWGYGHQPGTWGYPIVEQPTTSTCNQGARNVNAHQTAEPDLLKK